MSTNNLDSILNAIRADEAPETAANEAIARVQGRLFSAAADHSAHALQTCADFQALMQSYLDKTLPESRALLLDDHTHTCVVCRRVLAATRSGKLVTINRPKIVQRELPVYMKWAAAAAAVVVVGLSVWGVARLLPSSGTRATVQSVSGILYSVKDQSAAPIFSGRQIAEGERVRTGKQSTALLKLPDGSLVEMNERAEVSLTKNARGTTVLLDRGNVIVQAAKQKIGALFVSTPDCLVTVHGTVFAVTRGTKGTRVSVAEGEVKVEETGHSELLHPGDQTATNPSIEKVPVHDEFEWSRNSAKYLALLGEFSQLRKQIEQIPSPGLRYKSDLLDKAPWNTVIYAAIPNLGNTLGEATRLFNERIQQSEVLRQWWEQNGPKQGHSLDDIVNRLRTFSNYLGDEVVLCITSDPGGGYSGPMLLADVKQKGLREFLEGQARELSGGKSPLRFIEDAETHTGNGTQVTKPANQALVWIHDDMVAITGDAGLMEQYRNARGFEDNYFHNVIQKSYDSGVSYLFCANLEQIMRNSVLKTERDPENSPTGIQDVRYLIFERKEKNGATDNRVALNFRRERRGFASWLGAPGPMGSLEFVSPNAMLAAGFVLKNPQALLGDLFSYAQSQRAGFADELNHFEQETGVNVLNDIAGPLGTDASFAIDGPIFPVPNWEFAMETYSPDRLEWTIEKLITSFNNESQAHKGMTLNLAKNQVGDRTFYTITGAGTNSSLEVHYTYVDSYFVAGATQGIVLRAIQNRQNGYTLTRSDKFRSLLPHDQYANLSGLIYHNIGPMIGPIADQLKSFSGLTPAQKASIEAFEANNAPGLIYAYGEPNRIVISGNGPLFGLSLESLAVPNILGNAVRGSALRERYKQ